MRQGVFLAVHWIMMYCHLSIPPNNTVNQVWFCLTSRQFHAPLFINAFLIFQAPFLFHTPRLLLFT